MLVGGMALLITLGFLGGDAAVVRIASRIRGRDAVVDSLLRLFSWTPFVIVVLFLMPISLLITSAEYRSACIVFVSCVLALGLSFLGKLLVGRTRPLNHLTYIGTRDSSFPSAHTAGSFTAAFALTFFIPSLSPTLLVLAGVVALSRLYLQMHFLSDVAGGLLLAYLSVLFVIRTDFLDFLASFLPLL